MSRAEFTATNTDDALCAIAARTGDSAPAAPRARPKPLTAIEAP